MPIFQISKKPFLQIDYDFLPLFVWNHIIQNGQCIKFPGYHHQQAFAKHWSRKIHTNWETNFSVQEILDWEYWTFWSKILRSADFGVSNILMMWWTGGWWRCWRLIPSVVHAVLLGLNGHKLYIKSTTLYLNLCCRNLARYWDSFLSLSQICSALQ